jgi:alpha-D-ribose 1-methylphosphonate 5-triphosphate synthase subunit PhnL
MTTPLEPPSGRLIHATAVSVAVPRLGSWAVLLRGPSGSGKSDLALRLLDRGATLVSDDQVVLRAVGRRLQASPPAAIAGKLEVRGLGIVEVPHLEGVPVALIADLRAVAEIERLPEPAEECLAGISLRRIDIDPQQISAPEKLRLALHAAASLIMRTPATGSTAETGEDMGDETPADDGPAAAERAATRLVVVTGLSGAGRSSALRVLEDEGYEAIDNLPLRLLTAVVNEVGLQRPIAVGVDIRNRDFAVGPVLEQLDQLAASPRFAITLLFVDCDDEVLGRRFTETRRRHPLAQGRPVADGIAVERRLVAPLRARRSCHRFLAPHAGRPAPAVARPPGPAGYAGHVDLRDLLLVPPGPAA